MRPAKLKAIANKESRLSVGLPITHLNSPTVFETREHFIGSVIQVTGHAFDTETTDVLNQLKLTWHQTLCTLDENYCVYVHKHRFPVVADSGGHFSNPFAKAVDSAYQKQFKQNPFYQNSIYITLLYKGYTQGKKGQGLKLLSALGKKTLRDECHLQRLRAMAQLDTLVQQWLVSLADFKPVLLGSRDKHLGYSELCEFLGLLINAGKKIPFRFNQTYPPISDDYQHLKKDNTIYPFGALSHYLSYYHLNVGPRLLFEGPSCDDKKYAAILSIKSYEATDTHSLMLDPLLRLDTEFISTHSFALLPKTDALQSITLQQKKLSNVKDAGFSQVDALMDAKDALQCGQWKLGLYQHTLMLMSHHPKELETQCANASKCYLDVGITMVRERLGLLPAYWSQLPGNLNQMTRAVPMSSENVADFTALHSHRSGFKDNNHLGSAMTLAKTLSNTPHYLNYHATGPFDNPSPGHTALIGGNGSGKTVFGAFCDAELNRYGG